MSLYCRTDYLRMIEDELKKETEELQNVLQGLKDIKRKKLTGDIWNARKELYERKRKATRAIRELKSDYKKFQHIPM